MTEYPVMDKSIAIIVGLIFLGVCTLAMRKIRIHFDRTAGTITRITEPLLPLGSIHLFRSRSETRPIKPVLFAYKEKHKKSSTTAQSSYCLALATGLVSDEILIEESAHTFAPEMDKVRWLVGYIAGMKKKTRMRLLSQLINGLVQLYRRITLKNERNLHHHSG
jgi:hypothetical protein